MGSCVFLRILAHEPQQWVHASFFAFWRMNPIRFMRLSSQLWRMNPRSRGAIGHSSQLLNLLLPHGSRVPLVYPLRTTYLMLHLFRIHAKGPDTCNLHASE